MSRKIPSAVAVFFIVASLSSTISGLPYRTSYAVSPFIKEHSYVYNPESVEQQQCIPGDPVEAGAEVAEAGGSTGARVFSFLVGKGLSRNQALGIVANMMQESGGGTLDLKPTALNTSSGAYGIAQWYKERLNGPGQNLKAFAKENGADVSDFTMQVNFLWKELNTTYKSNVLTPIMASTTLAESSRIFLERFEVPCRPGKGCDAEAALRLSLAEKAAQQLGDVEGSKSGDFQVCEDINSPGGGTSPGSVTADGYANPVKGYKPTNLHLTCTKRGGGGTKACHPGDRTAAFDIIASPGTPVVAITDGTIAGNSRYYVGTAKNDSKCRSVQFKGDDGYKYWYGHTYISGGIGTRFKAGEVMGVVGSLACGLGGAAHLHIDRGFPKGRGGGEDAHRDDAFIPLMQKIFKS